MHAAVEQLLQLIPPASPPRPRDWPAVEARLGTALPQDYKQLIDTYGGGVFDETIWLLEPDCAAEDYDIVAIAQERAEVLGNLWEGGEPKPAELAAEGTGLLPFAYIEGSGAYLYWLTQHGHTPEDWTVMVNEGRGPQWEHHPVSSAQFILSVITGDIHSETLSDLPIDDHQFDSNTEIL